MIEKSYEEVHSKLWLSHHTPDITHELYVVRQVIPWQKMIKELSKYYKDGGRLGKNIRVMVAVVLLGKFRSLGDAAVIGLIQENRYAQYFCNVADEELYWFLDRSTLVKFRQRIGVEGCQKIESLSFERLRQSGAIENDASLIDSSVLASNIIYPTDVALVYKAFCKMEFWAKEMEIDLWWDHQEIKRRWKDYSREKKKRLEFLLEFHTLFTRASKGFQKKVRQLPGSRQKKQENIGFLSFSY